MRTFFTLFLGVMLVSNSLAQSVAQVVVTKEASKTPEIRGVVVEENLIENGNFDLTNEDGSPALWGGWIDDGWGDPWTVVDGAAAITSLQEGEQWHIQFNQTDLGAWPNTPYILSFVAWGSEDRAATVDFEDTQANGYTRYGATSDPEAINGRSEWQFNVTTEPKRFTFHVTFDKMVETTVQKIQFMLTQDLGTFYLDSVSLIEDHSIILIDEINITGGAITTDNEKLQIFTEIIPEDATQGLIWSIKRTDGIAARASISNTGLITPVLNEEIIVQSLSADGFILSNEVTVSITGQLADVFELSYIKNGKFDEFNTETLAPGPPWTGGSTVIDGVLEISNPTAGPNPWDWTVRQEIAIPASLKDQPFIFSATLWASEPRIFDLDFELEGGNNERFGDTPEPNTAYGDGKTQWRLDLTTEPTTYTLKISNFQRMDTRTQLFNLFAGMATPTVFVDNVYLVSEADTMLIPKNVILNGDMTEVESDGQATNWTGGWTDASPAHTVVDGVSVHTPLETSDVWRYQFSQNGLTALPNIPYIFKFKAWAAADRTFTVDFEDTQANGNNRYGATNDPRSSNGRSEWTFNITAEPTWYTFDVTFDQIKETTDQKVMFMLGTSDIVTYIDSVYLLAESVSADNVDVEDIILTGGTITNDNGTLQIAAQILPENATNKKIIWNVAPAEGSNGRATISDTGLLSAVLNGIVTVTAKSADGLVISTIDVVISGQVVTEDDVNIVKNGKFNELNSDGITAKYWEGWTDASLPHTVVDGISVHNPVAGTTDTWRYQFIQKNLTALPNIDYVVNFTAWADVPRSINVDFEDAPNGNTRYGASTDPEAIGGGLTGRSDWIVDITTEPKEYTLHVNFDKILPNTVQQIAFFLGNFESESTVYIDNVSLISVADLDLISTIYQNHIESFKIYPNPAVNKLYVELSNTNSTVAIYNSVGVKMEETIVPGTYHEFDVSRYTKGLYFVKANNAVVKFVK